MRNFVRDQALRQHHAAVLPGRPAQQAMPPPGTSPPGTSPPGTSPSGTSLEAAMEATRRELAVLAAEMMGAQVYLGQFGTLQLPSRAARKLFRDRFEHSSQPYLIVDPRPGLRIVDSNPAYAAATLTNRRRIAGERLFDVFPDNPGVPRADGTSNLYDSLQKAAQTGRRHVMAVQRYDVRDASGNFVRKDWLPVNSPVFDEQGRLVLLLHHVEDVTGADCRIEYV